MYRDDYNFKVMHEGKEMLNNGQATETQPILIPDIFEAIKWLEKAASMNSSEAMFELGCVYTCTDGYYAYELIPNAFSKGYQWFLKAAQARNVRAMRKVASLLEEGKGVAQDLSVAKEWEEKSKKTPATSRTCPYTYSS